MREEGLHVGLGSGIERKNVLEGLGDLGMVVCDLLVDLCERVEHAGLLRMLSRLGFLERILMVAEELEDVGGVVAKLVLHGEKLLKELGKRNCGRVDFILLEFYQFQLVKTLI